MPASQVTPAARALRRRRRALLRSAALYWQATEEIAAFICPALVDDHGHAVLRLSMGRLLDILLGNMEAALQRQPGGSSSSSGGAAGGQQQQPAQQQPRLMLFSGHDSTIMPLLTALGADLTSWPPYMSNLCFELWELQAPQPQPASNMATASKQASSSSSGQQVEQQQGRHVVRVLYNKQPLVLPGAPAGARARCRWLHGCMATA